MLSWLLVAALAQDVVTVTLPPHDKDRRHLLVEAKLGGDGPFRARDKDSGAVLPAQGDGTAVRWRVAHVPAGARKTFVVERGEAAGASAMKIEAGPGGGLSIHGPDRLITRFWPSTESTNKKPCLYPLTAHGANVLRGYPLEDRPGEAKDHPHHTGIYFAFGDVNGREYWSKTPIVHKRVVRREAGPVAARLMLENAWGEDLLETQDVWVHNAGDDAVVDIAITLTAAQGPAVLGKDAKMAKEGAFAVRVATGLTDPDKKSKNPGESLIVDAKGNRGEPAVRKDDAPWVDYAGTVDGRKVGVAVMDHPSSFRHPPNWHVRAYGLFAANPWILRGESRLEKGESLTLRYRVYVHAGGADDGKVADVYAGFAYASVAAE